MRTCSWRGGCSVTIASDEKRCAYHAKVADGFITTTRGESGGGKGVIPVDLTASERDAASRRQEDYWSSRRAASLTSCE